jgi:hypothetical protein
MDQTTYRVLSNRLRWAAGTTLTADDLAGCNIDALVSAGHLAPKTKSAPVAPEPRKTADQPKEQD